MLWVPHRARRRKRLRQRPGTPVQRKTRIMLLVSCEPECAFSQDDRPEWQQRPADPTVSGAPSSYLRRFGPAFAFRSRPGGSG